MIRFLRVAALIPIVCTCVLAQPRGKWARIDSDGQDHKLVPLKTCPSLEWQTSHPPVEGVRDLKTEVNRIGAINEMDVYDVVHTFLNSDGFGEWIKRIMVKRSKGQFCEIYRLQGDNKTSAPGKTFIQDLGDGKVLASHAELQGLAYIREQDVSWTVDSSGATELDFGLIGAAFKELVPEGLVIPKGYRLNFEARCYLVPISKPDDPACYGTAGSFFVKFALKGGRLVLTHKEYDPAEDSIDKHIKECPIN